MKEENTAPIQNRDIVNIQREVPWTEDWKCLKSAWQSDVLVQKRVFLGAKERDSLWSLLTCIVRQTLADIWRRKFCPVMMLVVGKCLSSHCIVFNVALFPPQTAGYFLLSDPPGIVTGWQTTSRWGKISSFLSGYFALFNRRWDSPPPAPPRRTQKY